MRLSISVRRGVHGLSLCLSNRGREGDQQVTDCLLRGPAARQSVFDVSGFRRQSSAWQRSLFFGPRRHLPRAAVDGFSYCWDAARAIAEFDLLMRTLGF
jgi:hypothetical protein